MPSYLEDDLSDDDGNARSYPSARGGRSSAAAGPGPSSSIFLSRALSSRLDSASPPPERNDYLGGDMDIDHLGYGGGDGAVEELESETQKLMRAWVAERAAPGLLKWEGDAVDDVMYRVDQQVCYFLRFL